MNTSKTTEIQSNNLQLAFFQSLKEASRATKLFLWDEEFKNIPWADGPLSLVVPSKAIPLLKARGLKFQVLKPITEADLTPEQDKALKEDKAILFGCWGAMFFLRCVSSSALK